jgi:hypothetical protein
MRKHEFEVKPSSMLDFSQKWHQENISHADHEDFLHVLSHIVSACYFSYEVLEKGKMR